MKYSDTKLYIYKILKVRYVPSFNYKLHATVQVIAVCWERDCEYSLERGLSVLGSGEVLFGSLAGTLVVDVGSALLLEGSALDGSAIDGSAPELLASDDEGSATTSLVGSGSAIDVGSGDDGSATTSLVGSGVDGSAATSLVGSGVEGSATTSLVGSGSAIDVGSGVDGSPVGSGVVSAS